MVTFLFQQKIFFDNVSTDINVVSGKAANGKIKQKR